MSKHYDPKMHSAEHLLNQAMVRQIGCGRCFSAHINKKKSKCDYHFDRDLTGTEIEQLQQMVNDQIKKDIPVTIDHLSITDAKNKFNIDRIPNADSLQDIRVVRIGDFDACACIGPHVGSTGQIEAFRITTTGFDEGILRIRFKIG